MSDAAPARNGGRRLGLIIFAVLASVAALPLVGLFFFRLYDNQLIRQTQAELIAQSRVLAAVYAREVEARLDAGHRARRRNPAGSAARSRRPFTPIRPALDLAARRPVAAAPRRAAASTPRRSAYAAIGARLMPIILDTQKVTLAGFRILDPHGVVIAGRDEVGQSLAHIEEVARRAAGAVSRARCASAFPTSRRRRSIRSAAASACTCFRRCR